jgi:dTDP-4-amino-4,6-dideoxygalactose transaminase
MNIPMVDLVKQYRGLQNNLDVAVRSAMESGAFILGQQVEILEQEVAGYIGVKHAIAVASGTDALHLALRAAGITAGDEVITTPFSFISTAEAISYTGALPTFVDIDPHTFNINAEEIETAINTNTKAVVVVNLYGQPARLDTIRTLCGRHGLKLIEDCAQSFGAAYRNTKTGAWGDLACFSFYPSKNLGAFGDGGMVTTDNDDYAARIRLLRNHGSLKPNLHVTIGYNSRLDELQAAILRVKLKHIEEFNQARRANAWLYTRHLQGSSILPPAEDENGVHVYHQYTIRCKDRDTVRQQLADKGIASAVYYPTPLHRQPVYRMRGDNPLPEAEAAAAEVLSLPMFPELTEQQIEFVARTVVAASPDPAQQRVSGLA